MDGLCNIGGPATFKTGPRGAPPPQGAAWPGQPDGGSSPQYPPFSQNPPAPAFLGDGGQMGAVPTQPPAFPTFSSAMMAPPLKSVETVEDPVVPVQPASELAPEVGYYPPVPVGGATPTWAPPTQPPVQDWAGRAGRSRGQAVPTPWAAPGAVGETVIEGEPFNK